MQHKLSKDKHALKLGTQKHSYNNIYHNATANYYG